MFCNLTFWSYKLEICFTISLKISLLPFCGRLKDNGFSCHLSSWPFEVEMCFKISLCWRRCSMLRKTMDVFVTYMFCFLFLDISLLVWCGVQNQRGFFCFDFVFQDIFLLAVVFKTRKGVLLLCFVFQYISLSVWCGVQNQRRLFVITSRHLRRTPISAS